MITAATQVLNISFLTELPPEGLVVEAAAGAGVVALPPILQSVFFSFAAFYQ